MSPSEDHECYICMQNEAPLVRPCTCNAHVHKECFIKALKSQNKIICTICKKPLKFKVDSYVRSFACNLIMFMATLFVGLFFLCFFAGLIYAWQQYTSLFSILSVPAGMMMCVWIMLWRLFCLRTGRCCWSQILFIPQEQRITLCDGTEIVWSEKLQSMSCTGVDIICKC